MSGAYLQKTLLANAISCLSFGTLFALRPDAVSQWLGNPPPLLVCGVGLGLLANAAHLFIASRRDHVQTIEVLWFAVGDYLWWLGSLGLVASGLWVTTTKGIAATLAVAVVVAAFGTLQLFALGQRRTGLSGADHWRRLGRSWMALRPGVKAWLIFLNLVFLGALAVSPSDAAMVPLLAYVASGPLLLGMAAAQGGLTRALGLAHLLPFGALLVWAVPQVATAGPFAPYLALLSLTVGVCLAFDIWDLARFAAGDRKPFQPPKG